MKRRTVSIIIFISLMLMLIPVKASNDSYDKNEVSAIYSSSSIDNLKATSAILVEANTKQILYAKDENKQIPIASLTKIMSVYLVMEAIANNEITYETMIKTSAKAHGVEGSSVYLNLGEEFTLRELLYAIEVRSANDATVAVAEAVAGSQGEFVNRMNQKAEELGMLNTYYRDCTGLTDAGHYSTVKDLSIVTSALINEYKNIFEFSSTLEKEFRNKEHRDYQYMVNRNNLLNYYDGASGLKTGFTSAAGYCLVGTAQRGDISLIAIVTGEIDNNHRVAETAYLLDYGFSNFMYTETTDDQQMVGTIEVRKGVDKSVETYAKGTLRLFMKKTDTSKITKEIIYDIASLEAPVEKDTVIGKIVYSLDGEVLGEIEVFTAQAMEKADFWTLLWRSVLSWFGIDWQK
ncbi:MAG: D-alanyl-D-alanine carboxypeptidase DacF precursor [Firmicutes bacterium ADurb.Bin146]|nr:MAG: D-alanyl-D-alanine carboxypeptidase DacF precursor [Firmicutes bacterium ADurb.Bin146]